MLIPGAHGNDDAPTFFLRQSNIYQKMRVAFHPNSNKILKQRICIPNIKSVSVIIYMFERLIEVMGYSDMPGLCRQSEVRIKNSISDTSHIHVCCP